MNQKFNLVVDGKPATVDADPAMPLLYALRDELGLSNPKFGCGKAQCGACTVHLDGAPMRSCVTPVSAAAGKRVTTLAGPGHAGEAASAAKGVHRRAGAAMRLLPLRLDHDRARRSSRTTRKPTDAADPPGDDGHQVPLRHAHGDHARDQARRRNDGIGLRENDHEPDYPPRLPEGFRFARRQRLDSRRRRRHAWARARRSSGKPPLMPERARLVDRRASRRQRHRVLRQDGHGPGRRRRHRPDRRRRAGRRLREGQRRHGRHRAHLQPGRRFRQHGHAVRRQGAAQRRRRSAARARRARREEARRAGRRA